MATLEEKKAAIQAGIDAIRGTDQIATPEGGDNQDQWVNGEKPDSLTEGPQDHEDDADVGLALVLLRAQMAALDEDANGIDMMYRISNAISDAPFVSRD